jgi:pimeloyl-ACP methyl ester carboxylesterase
MAIGMQDPVLGPPAMHALAKTIRGCPPPLELPDAGHFVQERGAAVAAAALAAFGDMPRT